MDTAQIQPIYLSHAQLFTYDQDSSKQWIPVHPLPVPTSIMFDATRGLYRLISVDPSCQHVIANSTIVSDLEFHKTSARFGHWTDVATGTVFGIGFRVEQQLEDFADCVRKARAAFCCGGGSRIGLENKTQQQPHPQPTTSSTTTIIPRLESDFNFEKPIPIPNLHQLIANLGINTDPVQVILPPPPPQPKHSGRILPAEPTPPPSLTRLRLENSSLRSSLADNVSKYQAWDTQLDTLRSQNQALTTALAKLNAQIEEQKQTNFEVERECERNKHQEGMKLVRKEEQGQGENFDCTRQAQDMESHYRNLLENANRALAAALEENMVGKETVVEVDALFCKAIHELTGIHRLVGGAYRQQNKTQQRMLGGGGGVGGEKVGQ